MVHLADRWGIEQIRHSWTYYSPKFKKAAIERVLAGHESMRDVSLDLGLSNQGTLPRWVKEYIANGYNVIEKKKGRKTHGKEETEGSSSEERSPAERNCRSSQAERDSYDTKRILKKIKCFGYGKREPGKEEIAGVVTELKGDMAIAGSYCSFRETVFM